MGLKLKGTTTGSRSKTSRPLAFKARVIALAKGPESLSAREALQQACDEYELPMISSYEKHPHTFTNSFQKSLEKILDDESEGARVVRDEVVRILDEAGLIEDDGNDSENSEDDFEDDPALD